jgi:hypothetical protein
MGTFLTDLRNNCGEVSEGRSPAVAAMDVLASRHPRCQKGEVIMVGFIILIAAIAGVLWYFGVRPFDRKYSFLPTYADWANKKTNTPTPPTK